MSFTIFFRIITTAMSQCQAVSNSFCKYLKNRACLVLERKSSVAEKTISAHLDWIFLLYCGCTLVMRRRFLANINLQRQSKLDSCWISKQIWHFWRWQFNNPFEHRLQKDQSKSGRWPNYPGLFLRRFWKSIWSQLIKFFQHSFVKEFKDVFKRKGQYLAITGE